jgi:PIN domain nuclease of toxin-antitoxin system
MRSQGIGRTVRPFSSESGSRQRERTGQGVGPITGVWELAIKAGQGKLKLAPECSRLVIQKLFGTQAG